MSSRPLILVISSWRLLAHTLHIVSEAVAILVIIYCGMIIHHPCNIAVCHFISTLDWGFGALGHIHVPTILSERPPILYPGTPQGHNRKETEAGYITYVELGPGTCETEPILVAPWLWQKKVLDVSSCQSQKELLAFVEESLSEEQANSSFVELNLVNVSRNLQSVELKNGEFQNYLNQMLWQKTPPRQIATVKFRNAPVETDKTALPKEQVERILQVYQAQPVFDDVVQDLLEHPVAGSLLRDDSDYQEAVLEQAAHILATDFLLEEEK